MPPDAGSSAAAPARNPYRRARRIPSPGTLTAGVPRRRYEVRFAPAREDWQGLAAAKEGREGAVAFPWVVWDRNVETEVARTTTRRAAQAETRALNLASGLDNGFSLPSTEARSPWVEALTAYRAETDLSQEDCARQAGVSLQTWWRWEHGIRVPSAVTRRSLARLLDAAGITPPSGLDQSNPGETDGQSRTGTTRPTDADGTGDCDV